MCKTIFVKHTCDHLSTEILKCTPAITTQKAHEAQKTSGLWARVMRYPVSPLPASHTIEPPVVPKHGHHSLRISLCPACKAQGREDEDVASVIRKVARRRELARDIQLGKYVQPQRELARDIQLGKYVQPQQELAKDVQLGKYVQPQRELARDIQLGKHVQQQRELAKDIQLGKYVQPQRELAKDIQLGKYVQPQQELAKDIQLGKYVQQQRELARDVQMGKYVQQQTPPPPPPPSVASAQRPPRHAQSSAPPPIHQPPRGKFTEVGLVADPSAPLQQARSSLVRRPAVRGRSSSNTTQQVNTPARPTYAHRRQESKDVADMGLDGLECLNYYRSGASSGMAFEHPATAAQAGSSIRQQEPRRAFDTAVEASKPLPPTPLLPRKPVTGGSARSNSIPRKPVPPSSRQHRPPTMPKPECPTAWKDPFQVGHLPPDRSDQRSRQPPNLTIPSSTSHLEVSPHSSLSFDRGGCVGSSAHGAARLRSNPGPQTPQISTVRQSMLNTTSPLEGLSAVIVDGDQSYTRPLDSYFVPPHTSHKSKAIKSDESPVRDVLKPARYDNDMPPPPKPRTRQAAMSPSLKQPAPNRPAMQPSSAKLPPDIVFSSSGRTKANGQPARSQAAGSRSATKLPPRDPGELDAEFDIVEDMWNNAAAGGNPRNRTAGWQNISGSSSRTFSREHSTMRTTPASSRATTPAHSRKPTPVPGHFGGWI